MLILYRPATGRAVYSRPLELVRPFTWILERLFSRLTSTPVIASRFRLTIVRSTAASLCGPACDAIRFLWVRLCVDTLDPQSALAYATMRPIYIVANRA